MSKYITPKDFEKVIMILLENENFFVDTKINVYAPTILLTSLY